MQDPKPQPKLAADDNAWCVRRLWRLLRLLARASNLRSETHEQRLHYVPDRMVRNSVSYHSVRHPVTQKKPLRGKLWASCRAVLSRRPGVQLRMEELETPGCLQLEGRGVIWCSYTRVQSHMCRYSSYTTASCIRHSMMITEPFFFFVLSRQLSRQIATVAQTMGYHIIDTLCSHSIKCNFFANLP